MVLKQKIKTELILSGRTCEKLREKVTLEQRGFQKEERLRRKKAFQPQEQSAIRVWAMGLNGV